jgi:hypothetical protein
MSRQDEATALINSGPFPPRPVRLRGTSVAATSTTAAAAAGMNGPPIMFMYWRLNTPKATVRGNNAFLNLLQMRLVPYW